PALIAGVNAVSVPLVLSFTTCSIQLKFKNKFVWSMNRESDDDFRSPRPTIPFPAAPRRPEKKGSVQSIPVLPVSSSASSFDIKEPGPSTTADACTICSKNLAHLNDLRKIAHVNKCLDAQESNSNHAKATEKWSNTIDCPLCGEPQPPGPHRAAHAKRCGKIHKIAPKELLRLMETQSRVTEVKKRSSIIHTKAPVPVKKEVIPLKLQGAPNSVFDESVQLAKALSASISEDAPHVEAQPTQEFTRIPDPNEKRRKRPRSYAIVELAPRSCKCEVIQKVHERFVEAFKVRKVNGEKESHSDICKQNSSRTSVFMQRQARLLEKLERLERLSEDLSVLAGSDIASDVEILCEDGNLKAHRSLLRARTSLLNGNDSQAGTPSIEIKESRKIVACWLQYAYSGKIEWLSEDTDKIRRLAERFGPDDLVPLCARMKPSGSVDELANEASVANEPTSSLGPAAKVEAGSHESVSHTVSSTPSPESDVVVTPSPESDVVVPEALRVNLEEPGTSREKEDNSIDTEDPLQGINLADSSVNSSADVECITIEDSDVSGSKGIQGAEDNIAEDMQEESTTSRPKEGNCTDSSHRSDVEAMQITLFDMPEDFNNSSVPSRTNKSPDLFDERSKAAEDVVEDFSWNYTPLRTTISKSRRCSLATSGDQQLISPQQMNAITASEGKRASASDDLNHGHGAYEDEYFNYQDPCLEDAWYEPVEMSQLSLSQSVEEPAENPLPSHMEKASARRGRKISVKESSFGAPRPVTPLQSMEGQETNENSFTVNRDAPIVPPVAHSTPAEPTKKKARFGSNVKVLKTSGITPMPCYEGMTDEELKRELSKFGLKPMGRKRAVNMLRRIYDEVHPVIDPCTPTARPLSVEKTASASPQKGVKKARARGKALTSISEDAAAVSMPTSSTSNAPQEEDPLDEDFMDLGDKTLNEPRDEPPEESMIDDTGILPKDLEGMTQIFLAWLRRPENDHLYNHMLSLQPVLIDELHLRMSRADSAVCGIPKKALANVLDRLSITFSLPQPPGGRRGMNKTNRKRK
ncbi:unnamed protein product, partial [Cylicocyclus nassatus]